MSDHTRTGSRESQILPMAEFGERGPCGIVLVLGRQEKNL